MIKKLSVMPFVLLLAACGAEDDAEPTFLEGEWVEETCFDINEEFTEYEQTTFEYIGNEVVIYSRVYGTSDCSGDVLSELVSTGSFEIGADKILGSGHTITQYILTIDSMRLIARTETKANQLSADEYCGITAWVVDEFQPILECRVPEAADRALKEIAFIDGNILYRGYYDERGEDGYSDMLDLEIPYNKQ